MIVQRAVVRWLSKEEGGRQAIPPGPQYIAPAKFSDHADTWDSEHWSLVVNKVEERGGPAQWLAEVHFWAENGPHEWLAPGSEFELYEGKRRVAFGRIE
jgi:hypothetical protein